MEEIRSFNSFLSLSVVAHVLYVCMYWNVW